jgi:hypothetical protein
MRPVNCISDPAHQAPELTTPRFPILNSITMRFSLFAVLSGLAALAVVSALPTENVEIERSGLPTCCGYVDVSLISRLTTRTHQCDRRATAWYVPCHADEHVAVKMHTAAL